MKLNFKEWEEVIKRPDWYKFIYKKLLELQELKLKELDVYEQNKEKIYDFFEKHLEIGDIFLGKTGKNWDKERKPIDTIVIHHTSNKPGLSKERLSAIELFRLYMLAYANPKDKNDIEVVDQPIYSGHFRNGKQIFFVYHWLIRKDGTVEQLLFDDEIGWQSGDGDINCRSVAIVLDNDLENSKPSGKEMEAVAKIIKTKYPKIDKSRIFGHREINLKTTCPSNLFLSTPTFRGWKEDLLSII